MVWGDIITAPQSRSWPRKTPNHQAHSAQMCRPPQRTLETRMSAQIPEKTPSTSFSLSVFIVSKFSNQESWRQCDKSTDMYEVRGWTFKISASLGAQGCPLLLHYTLTWPQSLPFRPSSRPSLMGPAVRSEVGYVSSPHGLATRRIFITCLVYFEGKS